MNQQEFLKEIKDTVLSFDDKAEVILYGSRARGDYKEDSDWDVLILTSPDLDAKRKKLSRDEVYEIELDYLQAISTFIVDKKSWDYWEIRPLNKNVAKEGIHL